jgi:hypothetical protein
MGSRPPSTTTAPARLPGRVGARRGGARSAGTRPQDTRPAGARRRRAASLLLTVALVAGARVTVGCGDAATVAAVPGDMLVPGTVYSADLDADGAPELILIDPAARALSLTDGDTVYHSRDKWQVVEASLGDTDHDGLLEVVTLLDDQEGRHLGLFAYFGGEYRERLVTSELSPRPVSLRVVSADQVAWGATNADVSSGHLVVLTVEPAPGQTEVQTIPYRWNGFGFTRIQPPVSR